MATVKLGQDNFEDVISANDMVLVDFWASWCGPCQYFAPVFEKAAEQHPDIVFGKVDTEVEQQLAAAFGISSIPTLMVFRDQVLLYSQPGALPAPALAELIARVKEVDMDDVRRRLADRWRAGTSASTALPFDLTATTVPAPSRRAPCAPGGWACSTCS
jgi:thioredoxin 1